MTTAPIEYNPDATITARNIQRALDNEFFLGRGNSKVVAISPTQFDVSFVGQYANRSIQVPYALNLTADSSGLTGGNSPNVAVTVLRDDRFRLLGETTISHGYGNEVQRLLFSGPIDGGKFTLAYGTLLRQTVAWSGSPATLLSNIQTALTGMFGAENTTVFATAANQFDIIFRGQLGGANLDVLTVMSGLRGGTVAVSTVADGGGNEVQRLSFGGATSGGTFSLEYGPLISQVVAWDANPLTQTANLQRAVNSMFGEGNVRILPSATKNNQFDVIFGNQLADTKLAPLAVTSNLVGGSVSLTEIAAGSGNEVQRLQFGGPLSVDTVTLTSPQLGPVTFSTSSDPAVVRSNLQAALDALFGAGNTAVLAITEAQFDIIFQGCFANAPMYLLVAATGINSAVTVVTVANGGGSEVMDVYPDGGTIHGSSFYLSCGTWPPKLLVVVDPDPAIMLGRWQTALDALYGLGNAKIAYGPKGLFRVYFGGQLAKTPMYGPRVELGNDAVGSNKFVSDPIINTAQNCDSRVIFDQSSGRWFAITMDRLQFPDRSQYNILLAVSNSSDPREGWKAVSIDADRFDLGFTDFPMLGVDAEGVYIVVRENGPAIISIPKSDLLRDVPMAARATVQVVSNLNSPGSPSFDIQPVVDFGPPDGREPLIGVLAPGVVRSDILLHPAAPGGDTLSSRVTIGGVPVISWPPDAPQPGRESLIETGGTIARSTVVKEGNSFWLALGVDVAGRAGVRWMEIDAATNVVKQWGDIGGRPGDGDLWFYYPSLAVNPMGDVVIGFSGSSHAQSISAYYVVGHTQNGHTVFGDAVLLQAGTGGFGGGQEVVRIVGDYSATVLDPSDPYNFWTIQEYAAGPDKNGFNQWGITIGMVSSRPSSGRPEAADNRYDTDEDTPLTVDAGQGVLANDTEPAGNVLSARLVQWPAHGALAIGADGSFVYTPQLDFSGVDTFTYWGLSGSGISKTATVTITVHRVDDAPLGADATVTAYKHAGYTFSPADFFFADPNDTPSNGLATLQILSLPTIGTLSNGSVTIHAGDTISTVELASGKLRFTVPDNAHVSGDTGFTFQMQDDGQMTGGGVDTSSPQRLTINYVDSGIWHNPKRSLDVDGNTRIAPLDALMVINYLNAGLPTKIPAESPLGPPFYDTSDDGIVAPIDALLVINGLNAGQGGEGESSQESGAPATDFASLISFLAAESAEQAIKRRRGA